MRMMRRRMCKRPLFSFEEIPPERAKIRGTRNRQAMPMARHRRKTLISAKVEMRVFCLLRRCPNPRRTQKYVLETLENSSGYAILQIADRRSTSVLFRFSLRGERIVSKNPIYICLGSLQGAHILPGLLVICVHGFFLR